jgi:hypothetical protein
MLLRIEVYEPMSDEQVARVRQALEAMGVGDISVERIPEMGDTDRSYCQNCDWEGPDEELKPVKDLFQRVDPGEPMPSGECPKCGCLCQPQEQDEEDDQPGEDDIFTEDHHHFYQYRKLVVTVPEGEDWKPYLREYVEREQFFPNVWWVSDHGNPHLISVEPDGMYFSQPKIEG